MAKAIEEALVKGFGGYFGVSGFFAAFLLAILITLLLQPFLRRLLFSEQEKISIRDRVVGSGCLAIIFIFPGIVILGALWVLIRGLVKMFSG